ATDRLQQRVLIFDAHFAMPAADEFGNEFHRTRPIERNQRRDVLDGTDLEFPTEVTHATRFQLEDADRVAFVENVVSFRIIERQTIDRNIDSLLRLDQFACITDDSERLEAKKIHLQQA